MSIAIHFKIHGLASLGGLLALARGWCWAFGLVVFATSVVLAFALATRLLWWTMRRTAVLDSTRMECAPASERKQWLYDGIAVLGLMLFVAGLDAASQLQHGSFSYAADAGSALMAAGALVPGSVFFAFARRRKLRGARAVTLAALVGVTGAVLVTLALAEIERRFGIGLLWNLRKAAWPLGVQLLEAAWIGSLMTGLWALVVAYPQALAQAHRKTIEADRALREAELVRLRGCLEPHFLLNSLNAVAGLVDDEPRVARRLLGCLGDLYRDVLERAEEVRSLGAEIAWLQRYAEILEARHAGALVFRWEIEPGAESLTVPTLLLQPLLENAVKHGALASEGAGEVVVRARVERNREGAHSSLWCEVEDDGPGPPAQPRESARGLAIVRQRLAVRYGSLASFQLAAEGGRTRAVIRLPAASSAELTA